jgi:CheY-like chemotaxis protein
MNTVDIAQATILLIDDEAAVLANLAKVLTAAGYDCLCAQNAESAVRMAQRGAPDLIVSDINLEGASGLDLCETLKRETGLADVPVMFLSGAQIPDIIRRSHAAGGAYYLRKPFDPQVLLELIEKALWMPHVAHARMACV